MRIHHFKLIQQREGYGYAPKIKYASYVKKESQDIRIRLENDRLHNN